MLPEKSKDIEKFSRDLQFGSTEETLNALIQIVSTSEKQEAIKSALESISNSTWTPSNIDTTDATYYYFLSFIPGTTKWRINRLHKTTYVSDYATGDSVIDTAWANRATQTYSIIY